MTRYGGLDRHLEPDWVDEDDQPDERDPDLERDRLEAEAVEDDADRAYEAWLDRRWES